MPAITTIYDDANILGASVTLANAVTVPIGGNSDIEIKCRVDNGSNEAPTDAPVGDFELWVANVDSTNEYYRVFDADSQLSLINPNGNELVRAIAVIRRVDNPYMRLVYTRTSGGGGDSRVTLSVQGKGIPERC